MIYLAPRFLFRRHEVVRQVEAGHSFMEIGAGNLTLTRELLQHFDRGLAVDFTDDLEASFEKLPEELQRRLEVRNTDFMTESVPGAFDCVVACEVMEHVEDDLGFLRKIHERLRPGGQAIISVPAKARYWSVHDELVGHLRRYEKVDLLAKAQQAGFGKLQVISYGYPWINLLSKLRVWLAGRTLKGRESWDKERQTRMSNHLQIPDWLQKSFIPLFINRFTCYPFAFIARLFNDADRSDGYILMMRRGSGGNKSC